MCLKLIAVDWLMPLISRHQDHVWRIKKSDSFVGRERFYSLQKAVFDIEYRLLGSVISWLKEGFRDGDVADEVRRVGYAVAGLEADIVGSDTVFADRETGDMTERIIRLMQQRPYDTFPEKYRWAGD
jgi:hypothetical protein